MGNLEDEIEQLRAKMAQLERTHVNSFEALAIAHQLALLYRRQGNYSKATLILYQILFIQETSLGPEHSDTLITKNNLAAFLIDLGRYHDAKTIILEVIQVRNRIHGPMGLKTMISKNVLATILQKQGLHQEAEQIYREAIKVMENHSDIGQSHDGILTIRHNLAVSLDAQGKHRDAEIIMREVIKIREAMRNINVQETLNEKYDLAMCLLAQGKYLEAEQILLEVIEAQNNRDSQEHPDILRMKYGLALCLYSKGQYYNSERIFSEVLTAQQSGQGANHPDTLLYKICYALCMQALGGYQQAFILYREVLEDQKCNIAPEHPIILAAKNNLAILYKSQGLYQEAERIFRGILEVEKTVQIPKHPETLKTMGNLASTLIYQGMYQEADRLYREVLEVQKRVQGPEHPDTIIAMSNIAFLRFHQSQYYDAERIFHEVMEIQKRILGFEHPDTEFNRVNCAECYLANDNHKAASEMIREIGLILWKQESSLASEEMIHRTESLLLPFIRCWRITKDSCYLDILDKLVSLRIARDLASSFAFVDPPENEDLKAALAAQRTMINLVRPTNSFDSMTGRMAPQIDAVEISRRLKELSIEMTAAVEKLRGSAPVLAGVFFPKWLDENEVREVIRPGEVALYLCSDEKGGFGVLVSADEVKLEPLRFSNGKPVTTEKLEEMLEALRDEVTIRKADDRQLRSELYRAIFSPVLDLIRGKDLVIIPTGPFRVVPYSLLCDVTGTIYLSNLCRYSLTPSLTALGIIRKAEEFDNPYRDRLLAVAHPVYTIDEAQKLGLDTERSRCVPPTRTTFRKNTEEDEIPLPGTKKEVDQIRYLFQLPPDTTVLEQLAATKRRLLGTPWEKYGHFHFACHARAVDDGQDESALVLSRYDEEQSKLGESDSFVTYTDILSRKIPNAVVVLSACDTARGKRMGADLFSLARAFQGAGARAVLATLWRIPDEETPEFVEAFYHRYRSEGKSLREALMETQEDFRIQNKPPHVWAPWVLVGE